MKALKFAFSNIQTWYIKRKLNELLNRQNHYNKNDKNSKNTDRHQLIFTFSEELKTDNFLKNFDPTVLFFYDKPSCINVTISDWSKGVTSPTRSGN